MKLFLPYSIILVLFSIMASPAVAAEGNTTSTKVTAAVKQYNGKPTLMVNGKPHFPMAFMSYFPQTFRYKQMADHDVHFYSVSLTLTDKWLGRDTRIKWNTRKIWQGPDKLDFSVVDQAIKEILDKDPEALIFPRIFCDSPDWWHKLHPSELGAVGRQSFSSRIWRKDASDVVQKIVRHVSASPYGNHVIGYMLCAGNTEEFIAHDDHSPCAQKQFRKWIWEKYGKDEKAIQQLFGKSIKEIAIPSTAELNKGKVGDFLDPKKSRLVIDYREFHSDEVVDSALTLCQAVKKASDGRLLTGVFYGYTRLIPNLGHVALNRLLESDDLDFVTTPCGGSKAGKTSHLLVGKHGFPHYTETDSIMKSGKLFYSEIDARTSLSQWISKTRPDIDPKGVYNQARWFGPPTIPDSMQLLKTVYAKALVSGWANWWFDLWGGWYDDEAFLKMFAEMQKVGDERIRLDRKSNAQIAVILDEKSYRYLPYREGSQWGRFKWVDLQLEEIGRIGAPYEFYLLDDLKDLDMSQFRMVVFLNAFALSGQQRKMIRDRCMSDDRSLVWMYAPGLINQDTLSAKNVSSLLGMEVHMDPKLAKSRVAVKLPSTTISYNSEGVSPFLYVHQGNDQGPDASIGKSTDGHLVVAEKQEPNYRNVLIAMPPAPWKLLQHYAKQAGVHLYSDTGEVVLASNHYLAVAASTTGKRTIRLPKKAKLKELLPIEKGKTVVTQGKTFEASTTFEIDFDDHTCRIFQVLP